jgi:hypothetical protein
MSAGNFRNIDVPPSLQKLNVSAMGRDNQRFLIEYRYFSHDGIPITVDILFNIKQSLWDTIEAFRKAAGKKPELRPEQIQQIIVALTADEYCNRVFAYYEFDSNRAGADKNEADGIINNTSTIKIGEPDETSDDNTAEEQARRSICIISIGSRLHG